MQSVGVAHVIFSGTAAMTVESVNEVAVIVSDGPKPTIDEGALYVVAAPVFVVPGDMFPHGNRAQ
jgi:hypothetical protein